VTPAVRALLIATVIAYFLQQTMSGLMEWFVFVPREVLLRPWSVLTYMFLHDPNGISHILFNMLGLYFFGGRVEERIGTRRFTWLYFISGIAGALLSFVFSYNAAVVGASAGVFGVTLAFAYFWPDAPIHFWGIIPIPARLMVIGYGLFTLFAIKAGGGRTAHFAHLGGYVGAYLYLKWLERAKGQFKRKATAPVVAPERSLLKYKAIDRTSIHEINREEVDRILDKISAQGLASLTAEERTFLSNFVPPDDRKPPVQ
jgi:membrane associated rhomboid family serine protease